MSQSPVPEPNSSAKTNGALPRRFRVVPPKPIPNEAANKGQQASDRLPASPASPALDASPAPPTSSAPKSFLKKRGFWIAVAILVTLGGISQIRLRPSVRAEAWLEPDPNARREFLNLFKVRKYS
ncbi:MAG: hypothetical protein J7647_04110 [Cyanobacteria bacterium SBLK]|nr:hypothetical protein [Cyanobacteria bacterium SBLK]